MVMDSVIDLNHVRRGLRLFRIILQRFGIEFFLIREIDGHYRIDEAQVLEIIEVITDWVNRCTGVRPNPVTERVIHREVQRIVNEVVSEKGLRKPRFQ